MARGLSWFVGKTKNPTPSNNSSSNNNNPLANQADADAATGGPDPEEERNAPKRPLPVTLPRVSLKPAVRWSDDHPPPNFQRLVAGISARKSSLTELLVAVNCDHQSPCPGDALLPSRADGTRFNPPAASREQAFAVRIAELDVDNDAAFRALSRTTKPGDTPPRLAYLRKFWIGLDSMAQYWDPSLDQYVNVTVPAEPQESGSGAESTECPSETTKSILRYKGRRISNGNDMPDSYRSDTVRALVEGVTSAFNCRVSQPYVAPHAVLPMLQIGNLELPIRVTGVVHRLPTDRDRARSQIVEGPIIGVLERRECDFRDLYVGVSQPMSEDDLMKEIAAMLFIGQGRRRDGKPPTVPPGEGKWYTTEPRWGGGPGSKLPSLEHSEEKVAEVKRRMAEFQDPHEELRQQLGQLEPDDERIEGIRQRMAELEEAHAVAKKELHPSRKQLQIAQRAAEKWDEMRPQHGYFNDAKADYKAIGKQPGSKYDNASFVTTLPLLLPTC